MGSPIFSQHLRHRSSVQLDVLMTIRLSF
jgi:hypothetical protein